MRHPFRGSKRQRMTRDNQNAMTEDARQNRFSWFPVFALSSACARAVLPASECRAAGGSVPTRLRRRRPPTDCEERGGQVDEFGKRLKRFTAASSGRVIS
jgi:hypothetical protein